LRLPSRGRACWTRGTSAPRHVIADAVIGTTMAIEQKEKTSGGGELNRATPTGFVGIHKFARVFDQEDDARDSGEGFSSVQRVGFDDFPRIVWRGGRGMRSSLASRGRVRTAGPAGTACHPPLSGYNWSVETLTLARAVESFPNDLILTRPIVGDLRGWMKVPQWEMWTGAVFRAKRCDRFPPPDTSGKSWSGY